MPGSLLLLKKTLQRILENTFSLPILQFTAFSGGNRYFSKTRLKNSKGTDYRAGLSRPGSASGFLAFVFMCGFYAAFLFTADLCSVFVCCGFFRRFCLLRLLCSIFVCCGFYAAFSFAEDLCNVFVCCSFMQRFGLLHSFYALFANWLL